jgi:hypothetical protein
MIVTHRILLPFFLFTAALFLALAAYISYLAFYPFQTIQFRTQPYRMVQDTVRPGDALLYYVDVCKLTDAPAEVTRAIVGEGTFVSLPSLSTNVQPGCSNSISATTRVPENLRPGRYHLELTLCYRVNPLRTICNHARTETFAVRPTGVQ